MDWWTPESGGVIGACLGSAVGVGFGAVPGLVLAPMAERGERREFSDLYLRTTFALGVLMALAALFALAIGQPWHVWGVLLLPASLLLLLVPAVHHGLKTRYTRAAMQQG